MAVKIYFYINSDDNEKIRANSSSIGIIDERTFCQQNPVIWKMNLVDVPVFCIDQKKNFPGIWPFLFQKLHKVFFHLSPSERKEVHV